MKPRNLLIHLLHLLQEIQHPVEALCRSSFPHLLYFHSCCIVAFRHLSLYLLEKLVIHFPFHYISRLIFVGKIQKIRHSVATVKRNIRAVHTTKYELTISNDQATILYF